LNFLLSLVGYAYDKETFQFTIKPAKYGMYWVENKTIIHSTQYTVHSTQYTHHTSHSHITHHTKYYNIYTTYTILCKDYWFAGGLLNYLLTQIQKLFTRTQWFIKFVYNSLYSKYNLVWKYDK
jgi:hypothetical protein